MARGIRKSDGLPAATKKSEEKVARVLELIGVGVEKGIACRAVGITYECWRLWCKDPVLAERERTAQAAAIADTIATIHKASSADWKAAAWKAEKLWPKMFGSRAVVDVHHGVQRDYSKLAYEEKKQLRALMLKSAIDGTEDQDEE